jgi:hypothetical protein
LYEFVSWGNTSSINITGSVENGFMICPVSSPI